MPQRSYGAGLYDVQLTFEEVHVLGVLSARMFDRQDVVGGLVALDAWVGVAAEAHEAVLAAQYQLGSVDDGHVEAFAVRAHLKTFRARTWRHKTVESTAIQSTNQSVYFRQKPIE